MAAPRLVRPQAVAAARQLVMLMRGPSCVLFYRGQSHPNLERRWRALVGSSHVAGGLRGGPPPRRRHNSSQLSMMLFSGVRQPEYEYGPAGHRPNTRAAPPRCGLQPAPQLGTRCLGAVGLCFHGKKASAHIG